MKKAKSSTAMQAALIGLIGTVVTVCSGLAGAAISGAVTVYQVERNRQNVALAAPESTQALNINTGGIVISRQQAAALDPERYFADLDHRVAFLRPLPGWSALEELTMEEQLAEDGAQCFGLCDQPVYRIRYGDPVEVQSDPQTMINGKPIPEDWIAALEKVYGPPPWTLSHYSQLVVNVFERSELEEMNVRGLPDVVLMTTHFSAARINRLIAEENSGFAITQSSVTYEPVRLDGEETAFALESWLLFAEGKEAYYVVEIAYAPQSGQSLQVWEDLQTYMDSFRVVQ